MKWVKTPPKFAFNCSKLTIEILEQGVRYVQSWPAFTFPNRRKDCNLHTVFFNASSEEFGILLQTLTINQLVSNPKMKINCLILSFKTNEK